MSFFAPNGKRLATIQKKEAVIEIPSLPKGLILIRIKTGKSAQFLKHNNL